MHEQMAGVTSRLDQTERALDQERATCEDIIKAEVERRMREAEQRIRIEIESEYADERIAMMYSFFGACKVKDKNPERWLAYVLDHMGSTKDEYLYKLLPKFWEDIN